MMVLVCTQIAIVDHVRVDKRQQLPSPAFAGLFCGCLMVTPFHWKQACLQPDIIHVEGLVIKNDEFKGRE